MVDPDDPHGPGGTVWNRIAASPDFRQLIGRKKAFIVPAFLFFLTYYFLLPLTVGYAPAFMAQKVWGNVNLAYVFALSEFFMAWIVAAMYVRAAGRFDRIATGILEKATKDASSPGAK